MLESLRRLEREQLFRMLFVQVLHSVTNCNRWLVTALTRISCSNSLCDNMPHSIFLTPLLRSRSLKNNNYSLEDGNWWNENSISPARFRRRAKTFTLSWRAASVLRIGVGSGSLRFPFVVVDPNAVMTGSHRLRRRQMSGEVA